MLLLFIFSLLPLSFQATSADIIPPFILHNDRFVGIWEMFGASQVMSESLIMLVPPLQYSRGSIWTNLEFPKTDFRVVSTISIIPGTGGGGFGFWFISKYGSDGNFNGGPQLFNGVVLLATVRNQGEEIHFHLIQDDGKKNFMVDFLPRPAHIEKLENETNMTISLGFNGESIIVHVNNKEIINDELLVPIDNNYFGVTAQSDALTSRFDLLKLKVKIIEKYNFYADDEDNGEDEFDSGDEKIEIGKKRNVKAQNNIKALHYQPEFQNFLRNPIFVSTMEEMDKMRDGIPEKEEADVLKVLSIIDESNMASYQVASFSELNKFLMNTLIPCTQSWHKRTLKMIENSVNLRNTFAAAWNYTNDILQDFNHTTQQNSLKAKEKIIKLEDILTNEAELSLLQYNEERNELSKNNISTVLIAVTIIEIIAVIVFLIYINHCTNQ